MEWCGLPRSVTGIRHDVGTENEQISKLKIIDTIDVGGLEDRWEVRRGSNGSTIGSAPTLWCLAILSSSWLISCK